MRDFALTRASDMLDPIRRIRRRRAVARLVRAQALGLDARLNEDGLSVLRSVFVDREYADYFPFYRKARVLDVGAHWGYFTLFAQRNLAAGSHIVAVEPASANLAILRANVQGVDVVEGALGGEAGSAVLYGGRSVNHSLFGAEVNALSSDAGSHVRVVSLGDVLDRFEAGEVDFAKLDCEGGEYPALLGASDEILRRVGVFSLEFHDLKAPESTGLRLVERLREAGFAIRHFAHSPTALGLNYGRLIAERQ